MIDTRTCEQCGTVFAPRREHARFCSARCRVAWNRDVAGDRLAEVSTLGWSITAMGDATGRLLRARAWDRARAFAVITEAVWWVTLVDATLVRYHPATYDAVLAGQPPADRQLTEETLAGLRFVRNWMGQHLDPADFIQPRESSPRVSDGRITAWTWKPVPEPGLGYLSPRGQAWELTRYRAYQAQLAGHAIGEPFGRAAEFLKRADGRASLDGEAGPGPRVQRAARTSTIFSAAPDGSSVSCSTSPQDHR
jgi:hypothetical protein